MMLSRSLLGVDIVVLWVASTVRHAGHGSRPSLST
jgi:hypothetical protein